MEFSRLERAAIEAIVSKPVDGVGALCAQFAAASVVKRDYTGVGFYTTISVPSSVPPMPDNKELREALFDGAAGRPKSDPEGWVFFKLWENGQGYISCLEGCTGRSSWPNEDEIEEIVSCQRVPAEHARSRRKATRPRSSQENLIPDCDNAFEVWRMNTGLKTLFALVFLAFVIALLVRGSYLSSSAPSDTQRGAG
jgi:hypothetical protein